MTMESEIYTGSRILLPLAYTVGIPLDQLNFVICQFTGLGFGLCLRLFLSHTTVSATWRYLYCLTVGIAMVFFMIGWNIWLVLAQVVVSYIIMKFFPSRHMPLVVFFYALGHMLFLYFLRLYKPFDQLCYDATYPLMMTTQKITTLAFSLGDWQLINKRGGKIQEERQKWAIRDLPEPLEYFSFAMSFQGVLAGPFCHFNMFQSFMHGRDPRSKEHAQIPVEYLDDPGSCAKAVISKLKGVCFWLFLNITLKPSFPEERIVDPAFIANTNSIARILYLYICLFFYRSKYYLTWILADAIYNVSGLGYSGKDKNGRHTWTGMSNVNVWNIETSTSLKVYLDNWNILTTHWLRHVCYMRVPFLNVYMTFLLSALWHGLFLGYYVTFLSATICVEAGRKIRSNIRPLFQVSRASRFIYEVITFIGTHVCLAFLVVPFVVLDWDGTVRFHNSYYWALYVLSFGVFFLLPSKKSASQPKKDHVNSVNNGVEKHTTDDVVPKISRRDIMYVQKS